MTKDALFRFDPEKNKTLKLERGISFEEIILFLENEQVLSVVAHPNSKKYPNQKMYIINISDYIYLVPFVREKI
jgi:uncharacterized DUF497 family protein